MECRQMPPYYVHACAPFLYRGTMREILHAFKYRRKKVLASPLANYAVDCLRQQQWVDKIDLVIPVPLHAAKIKQRGFNQAELLAKQIAEALQLPLNVDSLQRIKPTQSQNSLSREQRLHNIHGAFAVRKQEQLAGKCILLVDDIYTTGSTVNECARMLCTANAAKIYVVTVATGLAR